MHGARQQQHQLSFVYTSLPLTPTKDTHTHTSDVPTYLGGLDVVGSSGVLLSAGQNQITQQQQKHTYDMVGVGTHRPGTQLQLHARACGMISQAGTTTRTADRQNQKKTKTDEEGTRITLHHQ